MHSNHKQFNVLLLAAGFGTRLKPITQVIPKCLCPINGTPLLGRWLESVVDLGANQIFINGHAHANLVVHYLKQSYWWDRIHWHYEKTIAGTGGTLAQVLSELKDSHLPLLVIHVDNYSDLDIKAFLNTHLKRPNRDFPGTLSLFKTDNPSSCGMVETNAQGTLTRFIEKPDTSEITLKTKMANAAVYFFEPDLIKAIISTHKILDISNDLLPSLINQAHTYYHPGFHIDIGNLETYARALIKI